MSDRDQIGMVDHQPAAGLLLARGRQARGRPRFGASLELPEKLPAWIGQGEVDLLVAELEHSGLTGPLNYYRTSELNWEVLGEYAGTPVTVPALFIGGDRDVATIWSQEAIARIHEHVNDLRGSVILADCGHWIQQELPEAVNRELLDFLGGL